MINVGFIPVRGGSKGIPGKNIRPIAGRPLLHWTLEAALSSPNLDRVYVATDSEEIADVARRLPHDKLHVIGRSEASASDTATTELALLEFAEAHEFEAVALIQATSPLLQAKHVTEALETYRDGDFDSLLSLVREHRFRWKAEGSKIVTPTNYAPAKRPRRQDWDGELLENGAIYVTSRQALLASGCRLSGKMGHIEMPAETAYEIDELSDWQIIEGLLQAQL